MKVFKRVLILAAASLAMFLYLPVDVNAQSTGRIVGKVLEAETNSPLPFANVLIEGTRMGAATDLNGRFTIPRVPPGTYKITAAYLGYHDKTREVKVEPGRTATVDFVLAEDVMSLGKEVVVYGEYTRGQAKSLNIQRTSPNIVNVVSEEQFSRYPDVNAAETVQRFPSISILRDQGEGELVQIRGVPEQYNSLRVNGVRIPSMEPDAGRAVGLDLIQSNLIENITVVKAPTPDMDGDAMGGIVDFQLKTATDQPTLSLMAGGGYNNQESEVREWGKGIKTFFGLASRRFLNNKLGVLVSGSYYDTQRGSWFNSWRYRDDEGHILRRHRTSDYDVHRTRYGLVANLDYQLNRDNQWNLTLNHNTYLDDEIRRQVRYYIEDEKEERRTRNRLEDQRVNFAKLAGKHRIGKLTFDYSGAWSKATEDLPDRTEWRFKRNNPALSQLSNDELFYLKATSTFPGVDDPLVFSKMKLALRFTKESVATGEFNFSFPITRNSAIKAGGKFIGKDRRVIYQEDSFKWGSSDKPTIPGDGSFPFVNLRYGDPQVAKMDFKSPLVVPSETDDPSNYEASENAFAGYIMNTTDWSNKFTSLVGVRIEKTKHDYTQLSTGLEGDGSYAAVLPSAHFTYRFKPRTQLRLAVSSGYARPPYTSLIPLYRLNEDEHEASLGNPDLKATSSTNFDLMFEHYSTPLGMFTAGVFAKLIKDPVVGRSFYEDINGVRYLVFQPKNYGSAKILGFEVAMNQSLAFTRLPILSWCFLNANYTFTHSTADFRDDPRDLPMAHSPKHIWNASLIYDNASQGLMVVVAGSYRHYYFDTFEGDQLHNDIWLDKEFHLDVSLVKRLTNRLKLYIQLNNLTNQPETEVEGEPSKPFARVHEREYYSWWGTTGLRFDF